MKRLILEMGIGTDLFGGDYTKAACRAVRDAIGHYIDSEAPEDVQYARVVESFMHAAPARDGQEFASAVGGGMARMHANQAGQND